MDRLGQYKHDYIIAHSTDINNYIDEQVSYHAVRGFIPTLEELCEDIEREFDITGSGSESKTVYAIAKHIQNKCSAVIDYDMFERVRTPIKLRINEKISEMDFSESKTGKAYKVFRVKNGKLYPPMVANAGGEDTPIGVWLDAEEGEFAGLSKTGRPQVKSIGSSQLSYRPGFHLGDLPRAPQFDRSVTWVSTEPTEDAKSVKTMKTFISNYAKQANNDKVFYVQDEDTYYKVLANTGEVYFPYDFVWGLCDYVMDIDYQSEADDQGYMRTRADGTTYRSDKYQHSLAGLPKLPTRGYYKYRTNPRPDTVPWVITGHIKVDRLLDDFEVAEILGGDVPERQGGNKTLEELGL